jgi:hypothetical protein
VLFNTLAYAKFFAVVFLVSWALVSRRFRLLLPWFAVAGYVALGAQTPLHVAFAALPLALTALLCRMDQEGELPRARLAVVSVLINFGALTWLTYDTAGRDPLTLALATLRVPVGESMAWMAPALLVAPLAMYLLVRARKVRLLFILGASYIFYAHWDWRFLPLIWGSSTADCSATRLPEPRTRGAASCGSPARRW